MKFAVGDVFSIAGHDGKYIITTHEQVPEKVIDRSSSDAGTFDDFMNLNPQMRILRIDDSVKEEYLCH